MLHSLGRGAGAAPLTGAGSGEGDARRNRLASAMDDALVSMRAVDHPGTSYGYMFRYAPEAPRDPDAGRRLDALAEAMAEMEAPAAEAGSGIASIWTIFGQFLDHDLSAMVDRGRTGGDGPRDRFEVEESLVNLRDGALRLDSLYGPEAGGGGLAGKLARLMREPDAPARMRLDRAAPSLHGRPPLPADGGADLLRLGRLLSEDPGRGVTEAEILSLPSEIRRGFLRGGRINPALAVIGDPRNDDNLPLAQFHLAMLRLHNRIVDWLAETQPVAPDRLFDEARRLMRWHLQWLTLEAYLPTICDPQVLARVRAAGAPVYTEFANAVRREGSTRLPAPLEYVVGAGRFRYSMARGETDHNRFHGRPAPGASPLTHRASLEFLHASTGAGLDGPLPEDRIIEWERYLGDPRWPDRNARRIDTVIAPPRRHAETFADLARRILRRERSFNLPSAQACAAELNQIYGDLVRPLNREELTSGHTGEAVRDGLVERTPLWFYVLKEAEIMGQGARLGPLGSALVAETLIGCIANDAGSFRGLDWRPALGARPDGVVLDSVEAFLAAAEVAGPVQGVR